MLDPRSAILYFSNFTCDAGKRIGETVFWRCAHESPHELCPSLTRVSTNVAKLGLAAAAGAMASDEDEDMWGDDFSAPGDSDEEDEEEWDEPEPAAEEAAAEASPGAAAVAPTPGATAGGEQQS